MIPYCKHRVVMSVCCCLVFFLPQQEFFFSSSDLKLRKKMQGVWFFFPSQEAAEPLIAREVLASFHSQLASGRVEEVRSALTLEPSLAKAESSDNMAPLMRVVSSSELAASVQMELIDMLMVHEASLATPMDELGRNVLLRACAEGASPEVIDCLDKWNEEKWETLAGANLFCLHHQDDARNGVLVLAAASGNDALVRHLLLDVYRKSRILQHDNNAPIKVIKAGIESGNEDLVLGLLMFFDEPHEFLSDDSDDDSDDDDSDDDNDVEKDDDDEKDDDEKDEDDDDDDADDDEKDDEDDDYEDEDDDEDDDDEDEDDDGVIGMGLKEYYDDEGRIVTYSSCLRLAFEKRMFDVAYLLGLYAERHIWLCWRGSVLRGEKKDLSPEEEGPFNLIERAAKDFQENLIDETNPGLTDLLMARARLQTQKTAKCHHAHHSLLSVPDDIFRRVAAFAFTDLKTLARTSQERLDRLENDIYCSYCHESHPPFGCDDSAWQGYESP